MVTSGDWLLPHLLGKPHLTKPPLAYWLTAVPIKLFGPAEWAARFSSGVFFLITVLLTAELARTIWRSEGAGILAGWVQLTSIFPIASAHTVTSDVFLATFETAGILCLWKCLLAERHAGRWQMGFGAAWGLAFLTKGPPGLLPLLAIVVAAAVLRGKMPWGRLLNWRVFLTFFGIALPWYLAVWHWVPNAIATWRQEAITVSFEEPTRTIARWQYLIILAGGSLPGCLALFAGILNAVRHGRLRSTLARVEPMFVLLWFVIPFAVFVVAKQRLYLYVLPLFPPLSVAAARVLQRKWFSAEPFRFSRIPKWAIALAAVAMVLVVAGRVVYANRVDTKRNFKPLALAIAADAEQRGLKPAILLMNRNQGIGLGYYLGDIPFRRTGSKHLQHTHDATHGKGMQLEQALSSRPTTGTMEYLVLKKKEQRIHERDLEGHQFGKPIAVSPWIALPRLEWD